MHGAYDLISLPFLMAERGEKYPLDRELPAHLQLANESSKNPWQNLFMQDFILLAEFSEHEGPRPLFTIPEGAGEIFDKNAFAVHVMSVDYQTQTSDSIMVDDTQLIFSEDRENIFAYVHHFILYDIEARGFVRPYCMCYVSNCKKKILSNFEHFIQEFSKISMHFKNANKPVFHNDLNERLSDLDYIKDYLKEIENKRAKEGGDQQYTARSVHGLNEETIDSMLYDTNKAIRALETSSESHGFEEDITEPSVWKSSHEKDNHDVIVQRVLRERRRHMLVHRDIHELCGFHAVEGLVCLQKLHQNFYQPFEVFSLIKEETPLLDPFPSVLTIGGSFLMNFQKNIKLSSTVPIPSPNKEDTEPQEYHSTDSVLSVDSYQSCIDEKDTREQKVEEDSDHFVYSPFSKVKSKDLLRGIKPTSSVSDASELREKRSFTVSSGYSQHSLENSSEENNENAFVSVDQFDYSPPGQGLPIIRHHSTGDLAALQVNKTSRHIKRQTSVVDMKSSYMKGISKNIAVSSPRSDILRSDLLYSSLKHFPAGTTPKYTIIYKDLCQSKEAEDSPDPDDVCDDLFIQCYAQQLSPRKGDGPGGGILRVLKDYSYLVHLLYALLRGRTVVVLAEPHHERDVQALVTALWLFVPGHFRGSQQVVLWRKIPLKLVDLARFKLVGLCKSKQYKILPNSVEAHVTTLDFESGCLKTPPYQGEFLNEMLASRRCWKTGSVFLSYVHSIFLEISLKAFICYYLTCVEATSYKDQNMSRKSHLVPRKFSIDYMSDVMDALGILGSDANIIMYFIDLITQQQLTEPSLKFHTSDVVSLDGSTLSSSSSTDNFGPSNLVTKSQPINFDFTERMVFRKSNE